jgi:hypothetical protein
MKETTMGRDKDTEKKEGERLGIFNENLGYIFEYAGATLCHSDN